MKINPYKAGIIFYTILIFATITILGCKTIKRLEIRQQAQEILQTPDLTKNNIKP
jgi:hypothetical protein